MSTFTAIWIMALVLFIIVEVGTAALTTIWFAGGALVALILSVVKAPLWIQVVAFLCVSLVLLFITRPLAEKFVNKKAVRTNAESLIGKEAVVSVAVNNLQQTGQVLVGGQEWTARTADNAKVIEAGSVVIIDRIEGVKLIVSEAPENTDK